MLINSVPALLKFSLNRPSGPIQSVSCDVRLLCVCVSLQFLYLVYVLLLPFTKVESKIDQLQNNSLGKRYERTLLSVCKLRCSSVVCLCVGVFFLYIFFMSYYSHLQRWKVKSINYKTILQRKDMKEHCSQIQQLLLRNGQKPPYDLFFFFHCHSLLMDLCQDCDT